MSSQSLTRRFSSIAEVPIIPFAVVAFDHPDLELIEQAYRQAGAGLGVERGSRRYHTGRHPFYRFSFGVGPLIAQLRAGQEIMEREHRRLLAEGYEWDGMDGYHKAEEKAE